MYKTQYLLDRKWDHGGFGWYEPKRILEEYKPVIKVLLCDTTSSAGDWSGMALIKNNKQFLIVPFWQENRYPYQGFRFSTGLPLQVWTTKPTDDDLIESYSNFIY